MSVAHDLTTGSFGPYSPALLAVGAAAIVVAFVYFTFRAVREGQHAQIARLDQLKENSCTCHGTMQAVEDLREEVLRIAARLVGTWRDDLGETRGEVRLCLHDVIEATRARNTAFAVDLADLDRRLTVIASESAARERREKRLLEELREQALRAYGAQTEAALARVDGQSYPRPHLVRPET